MYLFVCLSICLCFLQWQVLNYSCLSLAPWNYQELCFTSPCYLLLSGVAHPQLREAEHWVVVLLFPLSDISFACLSLGVPRSLVLCFRKYIDTVNGKAVLTCLSAPLSSVCRPLYVLIETAATLAGVHACMCACMCT